MAIYATASDLEAYTRITGGTGLTTDAAELLIEKAQEDIDRAAGIWSILPSGLKFDPPNMIESQRIALNSATCAQAEYRLAKGEDFFIESQPDSLSAPDYSRQGREPRISPKAREHLVSGGLLRRTVRLA